MADVRDEHASAVATAQAIFDAENGVEALGHAYEGISELLIAILYELREAREGRSDT